MNDTTRLSKRIYTPKSQIRSPGLLFKTIFKDLSNSKELAWRLFLRNLSAKYRQSILGIFWAFFPPILSGLIFIILQSKKVVNFSETDIPYPVFVLIGTTLWQVFSESLNTPLQSVIMEKPMLVKINFPHEALILSAFYQIVFSLLIKSLIIIAVLVIFRVQITIGILLAPVAVLMLIMLGLTIGLFFTPLGTLYRDIQTGLTAITQFWFFLTPVVYPPPETFPYSLLSTLNPVSPILIAARDLITKGTLTNVSSFVFVSVLTVIALFIAWLIYRIGLPIIIERMSS